MIESSHSPSRCDVGTMGDQQEEHSSVDVVQIVSWVHGICGLSSAPVESKKMQGFHAAQDLED